MISRIVVSVAALLVAMAASAIDLTDRQRADIEARIKPVGEVCLHGDASCGGAAAPGAEAAARTGKEVYDAACMACHMTGAGGAPLRANGVPYTGINRLYLWAAADAMGYESRYWMTYRLGRAHCQGDGCPP